MPRIEHSTQHTPYSSPTTEAFHTRSSSVMIGVGLKSNYIEF